MSCSLMDWKIGVIHLSPDDGVRVILSGGGVRAVGRDSEDLGTHQAFWFAWSQFHRGTALWLEA